MNVREECYCAGENEQLKPRNLLKGGEAWDGPFRIGKIQKV